MMKALTSVGTSRVGKRGRKKQHVCFYLVYLIFKSSLGLAVKLKESVREREESQRKLEEGKGPFT